MRICCAICGFSSILTLTIRTAPLVARTVFSRIGPSCLHGPAPGCPEINDSGASKDPSTTSVIKVAVVTSFTAAGPAPTPPIKASLGIALLVWVHLTTWRHTSAMTSVPQAKFVGPPLTRAAGSGMADLVGFSLTAGRKRLSAAERHPFNVESLFKIIGLATILRCWPVAEFLYVFRAGSELAAEFGKRSPACVFSITISLYN